MNPYDDNRTFECSAANASVSESAMRCFVIDPGHKVPRDTYLSRLPIANHGAPSCMHRDQGFYGQRIQSIDISKNCMC